MGKRLVVSFEEAMAGVKGGRGVRQNTHFKTQSESLSATSSSGKLVRLDWVGRVESMDLDWARLSFALRPGVVNLSPSERLALIPSREEMREQEQAKLSGAQNRSVSPKRGHMSNARPGAAHTNLQPLPKGAPEGTTSKPFTQNLLLNTCR